MSNEVYIRFLHQIIDSYRETFQINSPLQLYLIWFKSVKHNLQILLINQPKKDSEKIIYFFGPYHASKKHVFQTIQSDFEKMNLFQYFNANIDKIKLYIRKLALKNFSYLKKEPRNKIIKDGIFCSDCSYWIYHGNMFSNPITRILSYFKEGKDYGNSLEDLFEKLTEGGDLIEIKDLSINNFPTNHLPKDLFLKGDIERDYEMPFLGGFIRPPIWFGDPSLFRHKYDKPKGHPLGEYLESIIHVEFSNRRVIIKNDGFMGVSINTNFDGQEQFEEEQDTHRFINFFLGLFLINDIPVFSANESEFFFTKYLPKKDSFDDFMGYSKASQELFDARGKPLHNHSGIKRRIVHPKFLKPILNDMQHFTNDEKIFNSLSLLVDAYTQLMRWNHNESFILSWVIIEQFLNYSWNKLLNSREISNKSKKQLNSKEYTASVKTNILNLFDILSNEDYKKINNIRKIRNDFMHETKFISPQDASLAYNLAKYSVKKRTNDFYFEKFQKYLDSVSQ